MKNFNWLGKISICNFIQSGSFFVLDVFIRPTVEPLQNTSVMETSVTSSYKGQVWVDTGVPASRS